MEYVSAGGASIPALGFGTARMDGEACQSAVETALEAGYRHVDTAQMYRNEAAVGDGIEASPVPREDVFVVTKVHRRNLAREDLIPSVRASLDRLGTGTVDLLLIHGPSSSVPVAESLGAMNDLQSEGLVEHVGVSNFSVSELEAATTASETPIVTNQVEYHPYTDQGDLLTFCIEHGVALTAYSPLDRGRVVGDETLQAIGDRYDKTAAQVALRWLLQQELVVPIPKAADPAHVRENAAVFDFELTGEEMERIFEMRGGLVGRLRSLLGL